MSEIPKAYEPQAVEEKWYDFWLKHNCFVANPASAKPAYSIVIPPPNVTGMLHMGVMKHRDDLGREKFLEHVWAWKEKHGGIIIQQLKKLGCSCDWTRERFTMDPAYSRCVQKVFVELYKKGLIYRGKRMVNWCPASLSSASL